MKIRINSTKKSIFLIFIEGKCLGTLNYMHMRVFSGKYALGLSVTMKNVSFPRQQVYVDNEITLFTSSFSISIELDQIVTILNVS